MLFLLQDLQTEIDCRQEQQEILGITGKKVVTAGDDSDSLARKTKLDEMNERWSQLRAKTVQIR